MATKQSSRGKTAAKAKSHGASATSPRASHGQKTQRRATKRAQPTAPADESRSAPAASGNKDAGADKPKLVRDSFTIPKSEYAVLRQLKQRALSAGAPGKKSEVIRAGVIALSSMGDEAFRAAMGRVQSIKTGRPRKPATDAP